MDKISESFNKNIDLQSKYNDLKRQNKAIEEILNKNMKKDMGISFMELNKQIKDCKMICTQINEERMHGPDGHLKQNYKQITE